MKMGAWSPLAVDRVRYVGDAVVGGRRRDQGPGARRRRGGRGHLQRAAGGHRRAEALKEGAPQLHPEADGNLIFDWELGDAKATDAAIAKAAHVTRIDDRTTTGSFPMPWSRAPRSATTTRREDHYTCWTTSQNPHLARLVMSAFYNVAPENKLRVIAPDVGGGFGSKIFIYPEEVVCLWASKKHRRAGEMGGRPHRELPDRRAWPRPPLDGRDGLRRRQPHHRAEGRHHRQFRRLHVAVLVLGADLSLCDAAVGPV